MTQKEFDIAIIGGGITGAGIFNELAWTGLSICIIEKNDFGSGTSGKSSKLVHGGLRYLKEGNILLTLESVHHRERLLKESPGLVEPIEFIMPLFENRSPGKFSLGTGLWIYDFMALKKRHYFIKKNSLVNKIPQLKTNGLKGGYSFMDAATDDSALVAKLIREGLQNLKAQAFNYCKVTKIEKIKNSEIKNVYITNEDGESSAIKAGTIINACGAWGDEISSIPDKKLKIRPLKGSHLILKNDRLNLKSAVSFIHPDDKRPVFLIPWEGAVLLGTTDLDAESKEDLKISKKEADYLLKAANHIFPETKISKKDVISSFSGIRPVISSGEKDPSKESREHFVWENNGVISVTGGKLTTFRKLAWDTIKKAEKYLNNARLKPKKLNVFEYKTESENPVEKRIFGKYGKIDLTEYKEKKLLSLIPGTATYLAEIAIASNDKTIKHLDDLMMRRLSIGMVLPYGGTEIIDKVKELSNENLKWNQEKWGFEIKRYKDIYNKFFSPFTD